jgi:hydroxypyruvate reductase
VTSARLTLLELFDSALRAVDGRACVAQELRAIPRQPIALFAIGKAAGAMTRGALDELQGHVVSALVITKDGHVDPALRGDARVTVIEAAHPVPDARSLAAGAALEQALQRLPGEVLPVFLVSGGSSSLVESLQDGHTLEELRALNELGLASGWDIAQLNARRARLSRLKGGGVARLLGARPARALFISDVPGDDTDVIGSGLLGRHQGQFDRIDRQVVARLEQAVRAVVDAGAARGVNLVPGSRRFDGNVDEVAERFLDALRRTHADGLVWGGESTVRLPQRHGRGGRNTQLALAIARSMRRAERLTVLAAGTDGTDGPTDDAGAIVDAGTIERAEIGGCDVQRAFAGFDSGTALEAAGDLVHTGPTGTNVGDILIGLKQSATPLRGLTPPRVL